MKRHFSFFATALLAAGLAFVSCEKPEGPDDNGGQNQPEVVDPVFPDAVTMALEAGGSHTLELEPNTDWSIELKYGKESTGWFWIQDGNSQVYTLRGKAGEKVSVTVCTGEQTDFDLVHECTLEMTMGEKSQTIATFSRGTAARTFSLAIANVDESGYDYEYYEGPEGEDNPMYGYGENLTGEKPEIPLVWLGRAESYRRSILISANFDWQFKSRPEWLLDLRVTGGKAGEKVEFDLEGDPMAYPLEDASGELVFCAKENTDAVYAYTVMIPGCGDMFEIAGFAAETTANADGEIYDAGASDGSNYIPAEIGMSGSVLGVDGTRIYKFVYFVESQTSAYWDSSAENTAWINAELAEWEKGGPVLQDRKLTLTVAGNEGAARKACVLAIPAAAAPEQAYSIFPDGQNIDEKYREYVVTTLTQEEKGSTGPGEGQEEEVEPITFVFETQYNYPITKDIATLELVTADNIETLSKKYAKYDKLNISDYFGTTSATYILAYYSTSQSMTQLSVPNYDPTEAAGYAYYPKDEWLTCEPGENSFSIWMKKPGATASQKFGIVQIFVTTARSYTIICLPEMR